MTVPTIGALLPKATVLLSAGTDHHFPTTYLTAAGDPVPGVIEVRLGDLVLTGTLDGEGATVITLPRTSNTSGLVGQRVTVTHIAPGGERTGLMRGTVRSA